MHLVIAAAALALFLWWRSQQPQSGADRQPPPTPPFDPNDYLGIGGPGTLSAIALPPPGPSSGGGSSYIGTLGAAAGSNIAAASAIGKAVSNPSLSNLLAAGGTSLSAIGNTTKAVTSTVSNVASAAKKLKFW